MPRIEIDDVSVVVDGADAPVTILDHVSTTLSERRVSIVGANGSGKSTVARLVNGLIAPTDGHVRVDGIDVADDGAAVRRRVGFVFTQPSAQLVMPTVAEDVGLSLRRSVPDKAERAARVTEILTSFGLQHLERTTVHALSGGQQQLLALAGVLATEPAVVVADEPTTLLDLRNSAEVADRLLGLDQQLVVVTHDLDLAQRCERTLVVDAGRIVFDGDPAEAIDRYRRLALR